MKETKECPCCDWEQPATPNELLRHVLSCEHADPPVREWARLTLAKREAKRAEPVVCCLMRKKTSLLVECLSEELCGVPDSEVADVETFEKSPRGREVVSFRFCPWCGARWVRTGAVIETPPQRGEL